MTTKREMLLGAHVSIAGGVETAPERGMSVGCTAMQIFTKTSNQWKAKPLEKKSVDAWFEKLKGSKISAVASHDSYLINLASPDSALRDKSLKAFIEEIKRASVLRIPLLVFHPGSHVGSGEEAGLKAVASCMNEAIKKTPECEEVILTIETTAGQGTNLGYKFEHLEYLIGKTKNKKRVGICVDTCHIFAAGYDLRDEKEYKKTFKKLDKAVGLENVKFFHLNDSKREFESKVDRHEHIGKGFLGAEPFRFLMNDKRFIDVPMVLETPKGKDMKEDVENLKALKRLIKK